MARKGAIENDVMPRTDNPSTFRKPYFLTRPLAVHASRSRTHRILVPEWGQLPADRHCLRDIHAAWQAALESVAPGEAEQVNPGLFCAGEPVIDLWCPDLQCRYDFDRPSAILPDLNINPSENRLKICFKR